MSTFIINLNDTIAMSDSAVMELSKAVSACQPYIQETQANWADVEIAKLICLTIIAVALIIAITIGYCYRKRIKSEQEQKKFENQQIEEDNKLRREIERGKYEDAKKDYGLNKQKSDAEIAADILKDIATLSRDKDKRTDNETATGLYKLFAEIKKDLK